MVVMVPVMADLSTLRTDVTTGFRRQPPPASPRWRGSGVVGDFARCTAMLALPRFDWPLVHMKQRMALRREHSTPTLMQRRIPGGKLVQQMLPLIGNLAAGDRH